jgi:hypothetical protein
VPYGGLEPLHVDPGEHELFKVAIVRTSPPYPADAANQLKDPWTARPARADVHRNAPTHPRTHDFRNIDARRCVLVNYGDRISVGKWHTDDGSQAPLPHTRINAHDPRSMTDGGEECGWETQLGCHVRPQPRGSAWKGRQSQGDLRGRRNHLAGLQQ